MKNLGGKFFCFFSLFLRKVGGGKFTKVGGGEKYTRSVSLRNLCDYPPPPPPVVSTREKEKYTRSVRLRNGGRGQGWGEPCSMAFGGDRRPWLEGVGGY